MPYITEHEKIALRAAPRITQSGQLAFVITEHIINFMEMRGGNSFAGYAEVLGVLEAVKLELYRRKIAPYEDTKMKENGDVW